MDILPPLPDAIPLDRVRRVLVVKLKRHAEVLLSSPVFAALKKRAPQAAVDALVYGDAASMLSLHPDISEVHRIDREWERLGWFARLRAEWHLVSVLRAARYDLVILLSDHERGVTLVRRLRPRWAVGPVASGRRWKKTFTHRYGHPRNAQRHVVEADLDALRRIGIYPPPEERKLLLVPGREAEAKVAAHLRTLRLESGEFIHIHPVSRWPFKCWPAERVAELIGRLQADGHAVLLTASPRRSELQMIEAIQARLPQPAPSLAGQLTLKEVAALTRRAKLFIGIDSTPMHIAAAMGTAIIALFGPSAERQTGPWGVPARVLASARHACRPCGLDGCGSGRVSDCLAGLGVDEVMAAVPDLLGEAARLAIAAKSAGNEATIGLSRSALTALCLEGELG